MGNRSCRELVGLLSRRGHYLDEVARGVGDRRKLVEEVDESRSTVYRSLNELEEAALVEETAGKYELTSYGELVYEEYRSFDESVTDINAAKDVLTTLSHVGDFDPEVVTGAEIIEPTPQEPDRPIRTIERTIETAVSVKCIAPTTLLLNAAADYATGESTAELLVEASTLEHFEEANDEALDRLRSDDRFVLHARQTDFSFGLLLVEDDEPEMVVVVYTRRSGVEGLIQNDSPVAVSWAREAYRTRLPDEQLV